jgi:hypothetical protein
MQSEKKQYENEEFNSNFRCTSQKVCGCIVNNQVKRVTCSFLSVCGEFGGSTGLTGPRGLPYLSQSLIERASQYRKGLSTVNNAWPMQETIGPFCH